MDKLEIFKIFQQQKQYFKSGKMRDCENRIKALKRLYNHIVGMSDEIYRALKLDLNKSEEESYMCEVGMVLSEISFMIRHCKKYSKPHRVRTPLAQFHAKSYTLASPYGSVLIISPWNYPFLLSIEPLVDAITAGNCVVVKPSEFSPNVTQVIEKLVKLTFEPGHVDVVVGGVDEATCLLEQDFDYIFYTGSTRVGKIVMQKASEHFTPITLEMGGKSPCIVDETANLELSAKRIVWGKFLNCGQTCVAPDYIYCHESIKEQLLQELGKQIVLQYGVTPLTNENYPKLINEKRFNIVSALIDKEKVLFGGRMDAEKLKIEPTVMSANFDDPVMQEEIFGPVLPIVTFKSIDEAIDNINKRSKPLALYIFSSSKAVQDKVLNLCEFGGGCVNDTIIHIASSRLAFGGLKQSGIGNYHGKSGFDTFTHYKSIVDKKTWLDLPMRYQPYSKFKSFLIKMFLR